MWEDGLKKDTLDVFDVVSKMECIKNLYLCGGTGISLQIQNRFSEDLNFELLNYKGEIKNLSISKIIDEVSSTFPNCRKEILGDNQILFYVGNNVKLSFFQPANRVPELNDGFTYNNLKTVSIQDALGMKLYTTSVRHTFRDYYDIYSLLQEKDCNLQKGINYALSFSRHQLKSKILCSTLLSPSLFISEQSFELMAPKYKINEKQISSFLSEKLATVQIKKKKGLHL
jgi:hypothetical protein